METRASFILVGAFVLTLTAAVFAFAIWLTRAEFDSVPKPYAMYFTGSVSGLAVGSAVRYRGVPVGGVTDIRIDPENVERVRVLADIAEGTPIKQDTIATLGVQGVTGVAYILLNGGTQASPALRPAKGKDIAVITSRRSQLETVLEKAPQVFEQSVILAERLTRLVDDKNLAAVAETLENIRQLSDTLAKRRDTIEQLLEDGEDTMAAMRQAAERFSALSKEIEASTATIGDETEITLSVMRGTAQSINEATQKFNDMVEENRGAIRDFSTGGLYEFSQFIAEARLLVAGLTRLSAQIERDPARFFFGDTQRGFEAK